MECSRLVIYNARGFPLTGLAKIEDVVRNALILPKVVWQPFIPFNGVLFFISLEKG